MRYLLPKRNADGDFRGRLNIMLNAIRIRIYSTKSNELRNAGRTVTCSAIICRSRN